MLLVHDNDSLSFHPQMTAPEPDAAQSKGIITRDNRGMQALILH